MTKTKILPHSVGKNRGIDFCGTSFDSYYYIIRSDVNCFLRSRDFNSPDVNIFSLHPQCRNGEHYLAVPGDSNGAYYYIIRGNEYRRFRDLHTAREGSGPWELHPNCRNGHFYFGGTDSYKYIIFGDHYRRVTDMTYDKDAETYSLHPECQNGLYYWACNDYKYFLKQATDWGIEYHRVTDLTENTDNQHWSLSPSVINFLPGGIAYNQGPSYGHWVLKNSFKNNTGADVTNSHSVTYTKGYSKTETTTIEHHWNFSMQQSAGLAIDILQAQYSFSAEYGGSITNSTEQSWNEETTVTDEMEIEIPPYSTTYLWQYILGFGSESNKKEVLYTNCFETTTNNIPPQHNPLPPA